MIDLGQLFSSAPQMWILFSCALLIGMSKTGMQGINVISIPLMAVAFGAKPSTGVILPMLCFADIIAVVCYRRAAEWKYIFKLLPTAVAGFFVAILVDSFVPQGQFKILIAACIFIGLAVMLWTERGGAKDPAFLKSKLYAPAFGLLGGFTTMIGNAAGPVMAVYTLSVKLPKYAFVGTNAWFFLMVNFMKLPLQAFVWDNISAHTLMLNAAAVPFILVGTLAGYWFVKILPEKSYRIFIISTTVLSTVAMLVF